MITIGLNSNLSSEAIDTVVENFFGGSRSLALKVKSRIEKTQSLLFFSRVQTLMLFSGGCGGAGLLGRHRRLLPLHQRGRGLERENYAQDLRSDIVSQQTPVQSVASMSI